MRRIISVISAISIVFSQFITVSPVQAEASSASIVISQLSTGDMQSGNNEFVELYNNSASDVDISNWCLRYATAADSLQPSPKYCFTTSDAQTKIYLSTHAYALIVTPSYVLPGAASPDGRFTGSGLAATGGHIKLMDAALNVIDKVGWGSATAGEGSMVPLAPSAIQVLQRKTGAPNLLQDIDNNKADFELKSALLHGGGVYELKIPIDVCGNIAGIQETLPGGYGYDEAGNCEALINDVCPNIDKIQLTIPTGLERDQAGACVVPPTDICRNIDGLQVIVPQGYVRSGDQCVRLEDRALWLSEILPNVSGSDSGREFIELYNPYDEPISLTGYVIQVGKSFEKSYPLPLLADRLHIAPHAYLTYRDNELGLSLLNTYSGVRLVAPAGNTVSETAYSEPADDESWAFIDGVWQYTDQVTPDQPNQARPEPVDETVAATACPAGKYRNPLTNRCRSIETDAVMLTDCQDGYYRNPDTNRCRKVLAASATLTPCQEGYSRNPETNRCRKDGSSEATLTPCKAGQERNPATNRCRNSTSALATPASVAQAETDHASNGALPIVLAVAAIGALGYGIYEWRHEVAGGLGRLAARFRK